MKRLLLLVICLLIGGCLVAQTDVTKESGIQKETVNSQVDTTKTKNAKTDTTQTELSSKEKVKEPDKEINTWELDIKGTNVKSKRYRKIQLGTPRPWDYPWTTTGRVVDTLGNPIEGVDVMFWIFHKGYMPYDGDTKTDKDGYYTIRSDHERDNRVFYKKGYRVAGEKRHKTRIYVFHNYTIPNTIVMVPEDYKGDESKYIVGFYCSDPIVQTGRITYINDWKEYYEFEDISPYYLLKQLNLVGATDTSTFVKRDAVYKVGERVEYLDKEREDSQQEKKLNKLKREEKKRLKKLE